MSDFDPGPGWTNVQFEDGVPVGTVAFREDDGSWSYWVREHPVPTAPGYYVAERPNYGGAPVVVELLHSPAGQWVDAGDRTYLTPGNVQTLGPLVRLEPRAVTARAVLDRVREGLPLGFDAPSEGYLDGIAREFEEGQP